MANNKKPELYLYLQSKLLEKTDLDNKINYREAAICLSNIRISKKTFPIILKEMQYFGLLEKLDKKTLKINPENLSNNISKLNKEVWI